MIEEIRIRGLGVIEDAVLEPHSGLTVVTGETGAGKTMILTGLGLLLGGRADPGTVRVGDARAEVEGRVRVTEPRVLDRVADAGGDLDDGALVLARTVAQEGRSRAFLGGRSVPVSVLAELADDIVAVHGQSDQQRLLAPSRQRAALDRYGGSELLDVLADYRRRYDRLREIDHLLVEITARARERAQEADLLRLGLAEVEALDPQRGEGEALHAEAARLAHAESLREAAGRAHDALRADSDTSAGTDAITLLVEARRALDSQREHDAELGQLAERLSEGVALVSDVAGDLAAYTASVESDPARLAAVEERRAALGALTRKYGATVDEVLDWASTASARLLELEGDDDRRQELVGERDRVHHELAALAAAVSAARSAAAQRFGAAVTAELVELAMPNAVLAVDVRQAESSSGLEVAPGRRLAFGPSGVDEVELVLTPHTGAAARPIAKGASGGELSRVMLAVEVVFAGSDTVPTLVFDEVDAGVGGRAAVEVGRRLARLAASSQVLVVTHLPQVAAFADRHVVVEKADDGRVTTSGLRVLGRDDRVRELARMLAGLDDSASAHAHAQELLDLAAAERSPARVTPPVVAEAATRTTSRKGRS